MTDDSKRGVIHVICVCGRWVRAAKELPSVIAGTSAPTDSSLAYYFVEVASAEGLSLALVGASFSHMVVSTMKLPFLS